MRFKNIISFTLFVSLLLTLTLVISACSLTNTRDQGNPTVSTSEDIDAALSNLMEQQERLIAETSTSSATSTATSPSSTLPGEIKMNIDLDVELRDLDSAIKGADSKGFSDSDLNIN